MYQGFRAQSLASGFCMSDNGYLQEGMNSNWRSPYSPLIQYFTAMKMKMKMKNILNRWILCYGEQRKKIPEDLKYDSFLIRLKNKQARLLNVYDRKTRAITKNEQRYICGVRRKGKERRKKRKMCYRPISSHVINILK